MRVLIDKKAPHGAFFIPIYLDWLEAKYSLQSYDLYLSMMAFDLF